MPAFKTLPKRSDFLRLSHSPHKASTAHFLMVGLARPEPATGAARVGFTVTKKLGNAVIRNRIRRRLREAVRSEASAAAPGWDYVLIARKNALLCEYPALLRDVRYAFRKVSNARTPS